MSPLADAIYQILAKCVNQNDPLITYSGLVKRLPPLGPPFDAVGPNDERLFRALGEVGRACCDHGFPTPTALVVRSSERSPGAGYYHMFHPEIGDNPVEQREVWERELVRVKATRYPSTLSPTSLSVADKPSGGGTKWLTVGSLRIANDAQLPTTVFDGRMTCPQCSSTFSVAIERNPTAVSAKQPAFVIVAPGRSPGVKPLGHLFIGSIPASPVLYYGAFEHCGTQCSIKVFFNRALRDRSDHHLTVVQSSPGQRDVSESEGELLFVS